eukprot:scaffold55302_cov45-Phaeocystis_antarctica.AAC.1
MGEGGGHAEGAARLRRGEQHRLEDEGLRHVGLQACIAWGCSLHRMGLQQSGYHIPIGLDTTGKGPPKPWPS